jgi:hypothetical protein
MLRNLAFMFLLKSVKTPVDRLEPSVNGVETLASLGLESGEFLTEGVNGLTVGVDLDVQPVGPFGEDVDPLS